MRYRPALIESRLSKNNVLLSGDDALHYPVETLEPHQFNPSPAVGKRGSEMLLELCALLFEIANHAFELHGDVGTADVGGVIKLATVDIFIWEIVCKVFKSLDIQFFCKIFRLGCPHSGQKLDVGIELQFSLIKRLKNETQKYHFCDKRAR